VRRGFKSEAERTAAEARVALGLAANAPIDPWAYAAHLKVRVLDFSKLGLPSQAASQLTVVDDDSWSAMTLQVDGTFAIVLNPTHAITRQRNDLMHELAHIKLQHAPARVEVSETGLLLLSDYSDEQEQEADWLAATLLLPRDALVRLRAASHSVTDIARRYGVSEPLCEWRLRMTGVDIQLKRAYR
jgi:IrrE N-terminal-like domain